MESSSTKAPSVKHRACDECSERSAYPLLAAFANLVSGQRKLACSKDPNGCDRCKSENISCNYSEQKPMGRPRKRRIIETSEKVDIDFPQDLGLPLYDDYNNLYGAEPYFTADEPPPEILSMAPPVEWLDVMRGPLINFGVVGTGTESITTSFNSEHQLSATSNPSLKGSEDSSKQSEEDDRPCGCLESIYLSMAALNRLPNKLENALKTVRQALVAALKALYCPQCGNILLETPTPPMKAFANVMLLGTLIPIIASSYIDLLKMIDEEADAAAVGGRSKTFSLKDYGGLCGLEKGFGKAAGQCVDYLNEPVEMPATQWRSVLRAVLRVDIYGMCDGFSTSIHFFYQRA
jgi:hypothetical protein